MIRDIPIAEIRPNPHQPRKRFDGIDALAESLRAQGQLTPILVRPVPGGYELVNGERRWRAARAAGLAALRAEVRELSDAEAFLLGLIENAQREDLSPIEEADAFRELLTTGRTQAEVGALVGRTQSYVAHKLRLLTLPEEVRQAVGAGSIDEGHARQLLRVKDPVGQAALCARTIAEQWPVTRLRVEVDAVLRPKCPETPAEFVIHRFREGGGVPGHDPYPEEFDPECYAPPVEIKRLALDSIADDPACDPRIRRDHDWRAWLAEIFEVLPPIAVFGDGDRYLVADGRYRIMAALQLGYSHIECRIYAGGAHECLLYGIAANSAGGEHMREVDYERVLRKLRTRSRAA